MAGAKHPGEQKNDQGLGAGILRTALGVLRWVEKILALHRAAGGSGAHPVA